MSDSEYEKRDKARLKYIQLQRHGIEFYVTPHWNHSDEKIIAAIESEGYRWSMRNKNWEICQQAFWTKFKDWMKHDYTNRGMGISSHYQPAAIGSRPGQPE